MWRCGSEWLCSYVEGERERETEREREREGESGPPHALRSHCPRPEPSASQQAQAFTEDLAGQILQRA